MTVPTTAVTRFCPLCDVSMVRELSASGIEIEVCSRCGSTWYDQGALRAERRARGLRAEPDSLVRYRTRWSNRLLNCPACDSLSLRQGVRHNAPIGHCVECNGFLIPGGRSASSLRRTLRAVTVVAASVAIVVLIRLILGGT